ncbi:DEAD/DEAH box helicase [Acidianus sp. HS-5]|uniref:DEAD/DEAH box helicase n=1 Tax=Acidianus sp. HS-5 TaxID=2886040 RepID=UPI001F2D34D3|nr:DEAD/DEAH box helicase [Acidianus sp. HS-5]BDC19218.1 helicase [Acidianus sp. HS-5]
MQEDLVFVENLRKLGYEKLTPIQKLAIPIILKGNNTLIIAPTGYGKTEAAIIPVFYRIFGSRPQEISTLYITPLKALNRDLESRLRNIGEVFGIKIRTRHGDTTSKERKEIIEKPPDVLITTPESLQYLILNEFYRKYFENLRWIIIDELQEMLDEKRGYELSVVLQRVKKLIKGVPQIIGISATIGNMELAKKYLDINSNVEVAKIDATKDMELKLLIPKLSDETRNIALKEGLDPILTARISEISEIIKENKPVLIFTNTRETAEFLANKLQAIFSLNISTHHGSLYRDVRLNVEKDFKEGKLDAIVATSSLELGIDIGLISLVIQYMSPKQVIRLIQRVGRSGHSLHKKAKGVIIPSNYLFDILECETLTEAVGNYLEEPSYEENPLDVLAHQIAGMILEGYNKNEILQIIRNSVYFSNLKDEDLDNVLSVLESEKIAKVKGENLSPSYRTWKYYYQVNMIPDSIRSYDVIEVSSNTRIGKLDEDFVVMLDEDSIFILGGKLWKVVSIDNNKVIVERASLKEGILPSWFGESIPVEKEIAKRVFKKLQKYMKEGSPYEEINEKLEKYKTKGYPEIKNNEILLEIIGQNKDLITILSPFGSKGNNTLGAILSFILSRLNGIKVTYRNDPYHIVLASVTPITRETIEKAVKTLVSLNKKEIIEIVSNAIKESPQFKWQLLIEAERFGAIDLNSDVQVSSTLLKAFTDTIIGEEAVKETVVKYHDLSIFDEINHYKWNIIETPDPSPLSQDFLDRLLAFTTESNSAMLEIFKRRLLSKDVKVLCIMCGWNEIVSIRNIPDKCPKCSSVFLTVTTTDDKNSPEIVRKALKGEKLKRLEMKKLEELRTISSLFSRYGKYAFIAIAVPGVGPSNAGRVLSKLSDGEEKFYIALVEEEKKFLRNSKYWK